MMNPSLFTILIFSTLAALAGLLLLRTAIRGKLISPNPHCRKCKFDLTGLDLTDPTPCPECGTTLRTNTPAITPGLRKKRKLALLASILFLLTAATGFAWPKLSTLPSIQSINIYDHFPESLLVKLATTGDNSALQTLHDRLIPGQVSDNALQKLITHAFKLQADESVPWDKRWGDVLLYAFLEERMTDQQLHMFLERSHNPAVYIHQEIGPEADKVYYSSRGTMNPRGTANPIFIYEWHGRTTVQGIPTYWESPYELETEFEYPTIVGANSKPSGSSTGKNLMWRPYIGGGGGGLTHFAPFPLNKREINVVFPVRFTVRKDDIVSHSWEVEIQRTVHRVDHEVVFGSPVVDTNEIELILMQIFVAHLPIPTQISEARKHDRTRNSYLSFDLHASGELEHGLLGKIFVRLGEQEIPYRTFSLTTNTQLSLAIAPQGKYLDYFEENSEFWAQAVELGRVDIIIRPRPELLESHPMVESFINKPIIFHDVPVQVLTPHQITQTNQDGTQSKEWGWHRSIENGMGAAQVFAELLEED